MQYLNNDSGAVTVDWVVLTAGLVGLGMATMAVVSTGTQTASDNTRDQLEATQICSNFQQCAHRELYRTVNMLHDSGVFPSDTFVATQFTHFMDELDDTSPEGTAQILENYGELVAEEDGRAAIEGQIAQWQASGQSLEDYRDIFYPGVDTAVVQNNLNFSSDTMQSDVDKREAWMTYYGAVQDTYEAELTERGAL